MKLLEKYDVLRFRLMTVERLRLVKKMYSYRELSRMTGVPETVLCRYVRGAVIPSVEQADKIWKALDEKLNVKTIISRGMNITPEGYVDLSPILTDPLMIDYISFVAYSLFAGKRVTKVLTTATESMVLGAALAMKFQVPLLIVKSRKEALNLDYYEKIVQIPPSTSLTYYIPKSKIKRRDEVILFETVISSGRTLNALADLVKTAKASIGGALAIVAVGSEWKNEVQIPVHVLLELPKTTV